MKNKRHILPIVFLIFKTFSSPFVSAGVPKDNADHLLFGGGFSLGTTLCELTIFKDITIDRAKEFRVASRRFYGAPASGSKARFDKRHNEVIEYVFDKTKNNFKN